MRIEKVAGWLFDLAKNPVFCSIVSFVRKNISTDRSYTFIDFDWVQHAWGKF
jgi:hypothetical protein